MSLFMIDFRFVSLALVGLSVGCTEVPSDADLEFRTTCDSCTFNSPHVDNAPIPELELDGEENFAGVRLVELRDPETTLSYELDTNPDEDLVARDGTTEVAVGAELIGWELVVEKDGVEKITTISAHSEVDSWTDIPRDMQVYAISYYPEEPTPWGPVNVCPDTLNPSTPVLTIIRGATYDREAKAVDLLDDDWVTFACAGEAAFKTKALGYTPGQILPGSSNTPATLAQQNATLKMITADYCGTGQSFTVQGTELHWQNRVGSVTATPGASDPVEAVWGPNGALCLDVPRLAEKVKVEAVCGHPIPSCAGFDYTGPWEWKTWKKL